MAFEVIVNRRNLSNLIELNALQENNEQQGNHDIQITDIPSVFRDRKLVILEKGFHPDKNEEEISSKVRTLVRQSDCFSFCSLV